MDQRNIVNTSQPVFARQGPVSISATVNVALQLQVTLQSDADPSVLEELVAGEGRRAARELYGEVIRSLDESAAVNLRGSRQRLEERWLTTLMGRLRVARYRMKLEDKTLHPVDEILRLNRSEISPALAQLVATLASSLSYRTVARLVAQITGDRISPQACMRIVRQTNVAGSRQRPAAKSVKRALGHC